MQELNRKTSPKVEQLNRISIPAVHTAKLTNGIPLYYLPVEDQEVVKVDVLFDAGFWYQSQAFMAGFTNAMLNAGTKTRTSAQIAEKLDFFGGYLKLETGRHLSTVSLFSLEKHLESTLIILEDLIKNSNFPSSEFENHLANRTQEFIVSLEKSETVAHRQFSELLFGEEHPYGKLTNVRDFKKLKREHLLDFYNTYYTADNCKIIVSGKLPDNLTELLEHHFGQNIWRTEEPSHELLEYRPFDDIVYYPGRELFLNRPNASQSSIRVGCLTVNQMHEDYPKLKVINTILGGYFGSRLMKNIREEKGYTYGITSMLMTAKKTGSFWISTEVGTNVTLKALEEIYKEVDTLSQHLVPTDELERVKNYMLGEMLRFFDGAFAISDLLKSYLIYDLSLKDFNKNIAAVHSITSEDVLRLSQKYFDTANFIEVIVGRKK